jgi:pimeloyl-ACP methyl ester carboxylesterase
MCALEAEEAYAKAGDGRRIFYRIGGKGPFALVMPVPWGLDSYIFVRGFSALEFYLALATFDPRGVGRSDPVGEPEEFSLEILADDAADVATAVGLTKTVVIGHSGGGASALMFALRHPERVSHLILVSTAAIWDNPNPLGARDDLPTTETEMRVRMRESVARSVQDPSRFAHAMDEILPRMRFSPERLRWTVQKGARSYDVRARLKEIRVPTLIIHGADDGLVPASRAEELHAGIAGARLLLMPDCGHWPHVERRAEFVGAVTDFLGLEDVVRRRA